MENSNKTGYVIKDKEMKIVNKLVKNIIIQTEGRCDGWKDTREMLIGASINIKSVRKYQNRWSGSDKTKYCYEVDIEVDISKSKYMSYTSSRWSLKYDLGRGIRSTNNYYRHSLEKYVKDELKYFGVNTENNSSSLVISKIKYKYE